MSDTEVEAEVLGFFSSDLELIEEQLEAISWLQKVELRRVWPDRLHIKIKEHKAIAHWNSGALINEYGGIFKPSDVTGLDTLPILSGPEQELLNMLKTFKALQELLTPIDMQLKVLNLNHRYSWSLQLANGIDLEVGRKNLIQRVERFITLYPLLKRESDLVIAKVDLRYDTGLAVTRVETSELQASL
ncbi:MAG: FtsQ-type POTRA domain-containing protein [Gammaproteobacteria bacterium]|nr:FtsQ-type POTRA domain-containing protein [Gammaproteobacteria bacterium]